MPCGGACRWLPQSLARLQAAEFLYETRLFAELGAFAEGYALGEEGHQIGEAQIVMIAGSRRLVLTLEQEVGKRTEQRPRLTPG